VQNLEEFVATCCQGSPGQLNYGSAGNGSAGHLAFEYLKMVSGTFMLHVPYRGTGPMLTELDGRPPASGLCRCACVAGLHQGGQAALHRHRHCRTFASCLMCLPWPSRLQGL